jgi:hypothetical protein
MTQTASVLRDDLYSRISGWEDGTAWHDIPKIDLSDIASSPEITDLSSEDRESSSIFSISNARSKRITDAIEAVLSAKPMPAADVFIALQEWEGVVSDIEDNTFIARLTDITSRENPEEEADFPIDDLRRDDIKLLQPGAVFRWVIGYETKKDGTKRRASEIIFRRLPQWTKKDIQEADKEACDLANAITWE